MRRKKKRIKNKAKRPKQYHKRNMKRQYTQTGKRKSIAKDRQRKAKTPGYRCSKSNKIYYEARKNRSDRKGTKL